MIQTDLSQQLRDPAIFATHVVPQRPLKKAANGFMGVGALFIVLKLVIDVVNGISIGIPQRLWVHWILNPNPGSGNRAEILSWVGLYIAPVLLVIGIVLFFMDRASSKGYVEKIHGQYLHQSGYAATQLPLNFGLQNGRNVVELVLVAGPNQPDADLEQLHQHLVHRFAGVDKKEKRRLQKLLNGMGDKAVPVNRVFPDVNAPSFVAFTRGSQVVVVLPTADPTKAPQVLATK